MESIKKFDFALSRLRFRCELLEIQRGGDRSKLLASSKQTIADLKENPLGRSMKSLKAKLDDLEKAFTDERWDDCCKIIEELRQRTTVPDRLNFMMLLDDASIDSWSARLAGLFVPALALVRRERKSLRAPLRLETVYHLALALFLTNKPESIERALEMIEGVRRTKAMRRSVFAGRVSDLEVLMMSLGAQTAFHLAEAGEPGGSLFLDEIKEEWKSVFAKLAHSVKRSPQIRAAALTASGIITRDKRRNQERFEDKLPYSERSGKPEVLLNQEMDLYRQALGLSRHESNTLLSSRVLD